MVLFILCKEIRWVLNLVFQGWIKKRNIDGKIEKKKEKNKQNKKFYKKKKENIKVNLNLKI